MSGSWHSTGWIGFFKCIFCTGFYDYSYITCGSKLQSDILKSLDWIRSLLVADSAGFLGNCSYPTGHPTAVSCNMSFLDQGGYWINVGISATQVYLSPHLDDQLHARDEQSHKDLSHLMQWFWAHSVIIISPNKIFHHKKTQVLVLTILRHLNDSKCYWEFLTHLLICDSRIPKPHVLLRQSNTLSLQFEILTLWTKFEPNYKKWAYWTLNTQFKIGIKIKLCTLLKSEQLSTGNL